ncbi:hypothetical protein ACLBKU_12065 [Erythrobacter sp. NE805]|uniref:hypothetical protein n=1 Tax=Erythrobacter sp. NE805 TaxID=3389875 RepID=UPI00396B24FD
MSGVFRVIGQIAAVAAIIPGPHQAIAAAVAAVSSTLAQVTAKGPRSQGSVVSYLTGANQKLPYLIGEAYTEGVEIYRVGYGGEINDVKNPYAFLPRVLSCCGPIEDIGPSYLNFTAESFSGSVGSVRAATGYYADYLWIDEQLGQRPESDQLKTPSGWGIPPNWSTAHKQSGFAAVGWSLKWSKKAKRFPGGQMPPLGKIAKGVKVYDPRADSTFPGGSGPQRITDESTWAYSRNPALHAITYAYGRLMNGKPIFGVRLFDPAAINLAQAVAWANVCDANGWTANGTIFEPGDKWNNLKRICEAGGAQPVPGAVLGFDWQAPRTSLYTVGKDDLAGPVRASLGKGWKNRHNVIVPRYRSPDHQWGYVQATRVKNDTWIAADGEEKVDERQWDLVTDKDQVTELAIYDLWQRREAGPFVIVCKPHMRVFRPGNCVTLEDELGAHPDGAVKVVIRRRAVDPVAGTVTFTCEAETDAKHTAALGTTGTGPPPIAWPTQDEIDDTFAVNTSAANVVYGDGLTSVEELKPLEPGADVTVTAQRAIVPEYPSIEVKEGDPGNSGTRTVTHEARRGTTTLTGGTWTLEAIDLGAGSASIDASTGTVTLSGIVETGAYAVRYEHTDGAPTDLAVNVSFLETPPTAVQQAKAGSATSTSGTANNNLWQDILVLSIPGAPAGRVTFGDYGLRPLSFLNVVAATGTADFEARLTLDGVTLTSVLSQSVVVGGVLQFAQWDELFAGAYDVTAGTREFRIQMRRTSGTGTITTTSTALEAQILQT